MVGRGIISPGEEFTYTFTADTGRSSSAQRPRQLA
jgi:hypothetical protein